MERSIIKIGKPQIVTQDGKSSLRAVINDDGMEKVLEYKVDQKYEQYLTFERSDAFIVALLYYAMIKDKDIEWETPCNRQLIQQLRDYFIPVYDQEMAFMHRIALKGPTTMEALPCEGGVATGLSNGVDSCYTVHKYLNHEFPEYRLTHVFFTGWFITNFPKDYQEDFLAQYLGLLPGCAKELGLEFVYVEFYPDIEFSVGAVNDKVCGCITDAGLGSLKYCSLAMALQKLVKLYFYSSGFTSSGYSFKSDDMSHHDIFTLPLISTDRLKFISSGMETSRIDKIDAIKDWEYAQKHLQVCLDYNDTNCGHCFKCIRTMSDMRAFGKLEQYGKIFPIDDFKSHLVQRYAYIMAMARNSHADGQILFAESVDKLKENRVPIPFMSYVLWPAYALIEFLRAKFRTVKWVRKIYLTLHFDKVLHRHWKWDISHTMNHVLFKTEENAENESSS